jgi:hypothetical protein
VPARKRVGLEESSERSGERLPMQSSVIVSADYDEAEATLDITFTSGKTYRYFDVPGDVYAALMDAESKGMFFNENIKGVFAFAEVIKSEKP